MRMTDSRRLRKSPTHVAKCGGRGSPYAGMYNEASPDDRDLSRRVLIVALRHRSSCSGAAARGCPLNPFRPSSKCAASAGFSVAPFPQSGVHRAFISDFAFVPPHEARRTRTRAVRESTAAVSVEGCVHT